MADNVTLVRSLYDGWNNRDFDVLADAIGAGRHDHVHGVG